LAPLVDLVAFVDNKLRETSFDRGRVAVSIGLPVAWLASMDVVFKVVARLLGQPDPTFLDTCVDFKRRLLSSRTCGQPGPPRQPPE